MNRQSRCEQVERACTSVDRFWAKQDLNWVFLNILLIFNCGSIMRKVYSYIFLSSGIPSLWITRFRFTLKVLDALSVSLYGNTVGCL